jgi:hypothetical protein
VLKRLDRVVRRSRELAGLWLYTEGLAIWHGRIRARERAAYEQLVLLEDEIESGAETARLLERIGRAKGLLTALMLALLLAQIVDGSAPMRRPGRRREEVCVTGEWIQTGGRV